MIIFIFIDVTLKQITSNWPNCWHSLENSMPGLEWKLLKIFDSSHTQITSILIFQSGTSYSILSLIGRSFT